MENGGLRHSTLIFWCRVGVSSEWPDCPWSTTPPADRPRQLSVGRWPPYHAPSLAQPGDAVRMIWIWMLGVFWLHNHIQYYLYYVILYILYHIISSCIKGVAMVLWITDDNCWCLHDPMIRIITYKIDKHLQSQHCIRIPCIRKSGAGFVSRVYVLWNVYGNGN